MKFRKTQVSALATDLSLEVKGTVLLTAIAIAMALALHSGCDKTDPTAPSMSTLALTAEPPSLGLHSGETGTSTITAILTHDGSPVRGVRIRFTKTGGGSLRFGA